MQPAEAVSQANWDAVDAAAEARESVEMVSQLFNFYSLPSESSHEPGLGLSSLFWSDHNGGGEQLYVSDNGVGSMLHFWPQPTCSSQFAGANLGPAFVPPGNSVNYQAFNYKAGGAPSVGPLNFCTSEEQNESSLLVSVDDLLQDPTESENEEASSDFNGASQSNGSQSGLVSDRKPQPKRAKPQASETDKSDHRDDHIKDSTPCSSKKKPRSALIASNGGKSAHKKKPSKTAASRGDAEDNSACSEYSSSASQEIAGGGRASSASKSSASPSSKGKARAGRGSATDPQSLYARKRRERINERLKILQNLVPNGTKVDISTMLEEAVQYVKFLQLQIKLLSSDDLWMYAPIAYNGMNIGLDLKISPPQ